MTAADTDVRPGRHTPAATPRGAGGSRLARLLLDFLEKLARKLDRKAVLPLLLAASLLPACIIPVGPEWQDPVGVPNAAPQILDPVPFWGADDVVPDANMIRRFEFFVIDLNGDPLEIRVLADNNRADDIPKPGNGTPVRHDVFFEITCFDVDTTKTRHTILAAVTDSAFTNLDPLNPLEVEAGTPAIVTWVLNMTCSTSSQ